MNVGIYLTLVEQFTVALVAGILAIATPQIVGASVPSFAPWLFAVGCFVGCGVQGVGFIGVFKEKAGLFQRYVQLNGFVFSYVFGVGATWIIVSATRHNVASTTCISNFFANTSSTTDTGSAFDQSGQGATICNIFTWVDIGIMGGLLLVMLIFQGYLVLITRWYSATQVADHTKYYSIYETTAPEGISLGERQRDAWDPRPSTDSWSGGNNVNMIPGPSTQKDIRPMHDRQNSGSSERTYGVGAPGYPVEKNSNVGYSDREAYNPYLNQPNQAYTADTEPTPVEWAPASRRQQSRDSYGGGSNVPPPAGAMYPNEGQFGRKTPRAEDAYGRQEPAYGNRYPEDGRYGQQQQQGYYQQR